MLTKIVRERKRAMMFRINGEFMTLRPDAYYGGRHERSRFEYLYRLPDGKWFLHTVDVGTLAEPTFVEIPEADAVSRLIQLSRAEERLTDQQDRTLRLAPDWVI